MAARPERRCAGSAPGAINSPERYDDVSMTIADADVCLSRTRNALLARIQRRFETVTDTFQIDGRPFPFLRVADPNRVLDEVAEAEDRRECESGERLPGDQLHLPYWAELWDSALAVAQMLGQEHQALDLKNKNVLDLGCGMGLTGSVAAMLGAQVTFADLEPPALLFARYNSLPWRHRVKARRLNWRTQRLAEHYDLIIGADILYERAQWEALELFWREHLARGGKVLLGEPGRPTGDLFIDWIQARRWRLIMWKQPVETRSTPVRLFWLDEPR